MTEEAIEGVGPEPLAGLVREHRLIERTVTETLTAVRMVVAAPDAEARVTEALERLWTLQLLLEREVALHIEKEEQVLFPVLRDLVKGVSPLVDHMIWEHDVIKARRDSVGQALAALDAQHEEVHRLQDAVRDAAAGVHDGDVVANLRDLGDLLEQLDWVFQGHFTGEEDGLFLPAEDVLSAATFAEMAERMTALEAVWPA